MTSMCEISQQSTKGGSTTCRLRKVEKSDIFLCGSKNVWGEITSCRYKSLNVIDAGKQESEDCRKQTVRQDRRDSLKRKEVPGRQIKSPSDLLDIQIPDIQEIHKGVVHNFWTQDLISKLGSVIYLSRDSFSTIYQIFSISCLLVLALLLARQHIQDRRKCKSSVTLLE